MLRRRFLLTAASAAATMPFVGLAGCGSSSDDEPQPIPPSDAVLSLPTDMYRHVGAPTEWWWHIGTLKAGERIFGFEINAASFAQDGVGFTEMMLSDVEEQRHLERTTFFQPFDVNTWAEADPSKDWYARLGEPSATNSCQSFIAMASPAADPTQNMRVQASFCDDPTNIPVKFDLEMSQQGRPFFVWGTGVQPPGGKAGELDKNNYYFSLTRMQVAGSIEVDGQPFDVSGMTWMDHEYGAFGTAVNPTKWFLQDMQLDNGVCLSNAASPKTPPQLNVQTESTVTLQDREGNIFFLPSFVTPIGRTWKSRASGHTYFMQFHVEIPAFQASLMVNSLLDSQEFFNPLRSVYEGVAEASGTFRGRRVAGTAWIEQAL